MVMPAWYDKLVEAKMHKVTQLSEAETAKEIADITEGVFSSTTDTGPAIPNDSGTVAQEGTDHLNVVIKKKRGRPKGSKNRPKSQV